MPLENEIFFQAHWLLLVSLAVTITYCAISAKKKKLSRDSLVDVFATFLSTASIMSGIKLAVHTLIKNKVIADPSNLEDSELAYTIIGGCVVAWIALWELIKRFKDLQE